MALSYYVFPKDQTESPIIFCFKYLDIYHFFSFSDYLNISIFISPFLIYLFLFLLLYLLISILTVYISLSHSLSFFHTIFFSLLSLSYYVFPSTYLSTTFFSLSLSFLSISFSLFCTISFSLYLTVYISLSRTLYFSFTLSLSPFLLYLYIFSEDQTEFIIIFFLIYLAI